MKPREGVRREFVRQWFRKADEDLAVARLLMTERPDLRYASAFHAQTLTQVGAAFGLAELVRDAVLAHLPDEFGTERREG